MMIVSATKSLYEMSSVAVKVEIASSKSSPAVANCRMETACKPRYTLRRFRRSQSPPSSMSLSSVSDDRRGALGDRLFCFGEVLGDESVVPKEYAYPYESH